MVSFTPDLSNLTRFANLFTQSGGRSSQTLTNFEVQTQTGLSIVTAEGDRVTLSTSATFQGTGENYNARGVMEGQAISLRSNIVEGAVSSQKQLTIEGELNEQEIQDIENIISQLNGLRENVVSGDLQAALIKGQEIVAGGSIASIDLEVYYAESVSVSQSSVQYETGQLDGHTGSAASGENTDGNASLALELGLLQGGFSAIRQPDRTGHEELQNSGATPSEHAGAAFAQETTPQPFLPRILEEIGKEARRRGKSLEALSEKILEAAEKIDRLAGKLRRAVDTTVTRIEKDKENISSLLAEGRLDEADELRERTDRRIQRLGKTTERLSERIARTADTLGEVVDSLDKRLAEADSQESLPADGASTEPTDSTDSAISQTENQPASS